METGPSGRTCCWPMSCVGEAQRSAQDLEELFRRMVFNALISNTDDHPRNHALIAPTAKWELSPAYDLTPKPADQRREARSCDDPAELTTAMQTVPICSHNMGSSGSRLSAREPSSTRFNKL